MPSTTVTRHLRNRAEIARILEAEADSPESKRVMRQLVVHYEAWAERLERDDGTSTPAPVPVSAALS